MDQAQDLFCVGLEILFLTAVITIFLLDVFIKLPDVIMFDEVILRNRREM